LASLMRAVWTGRAGDTLRIYGLDPLLEASADGSVLGACFLFKTTVDHALARGMRVVWVSTGPLTTHARHAARELWCRRALATRCHGVVTSWRADLETFRELGVPHERIIVAPEADPTSRIARLIERRRVPGSVPLSIVIPIRNRAGADLRN